MKFYTSSLKNELMLMTVYFISPKVLVMHLLALPLRAMDSDQRDQQVHQH